MVRGGTLRCLPGPDDPGWRKRLGLLSGLYRTVSGVAGDPETVRETFAGLGLVPADQDLSAPLSEGLFCRILSEGFEADLSTDTPDRVIPRGELADLLVSLFE